MKIKVKARIFFGGVATDTIRGVLSNENPERVPVLVTEDGKVVIQPYKVLSIVG